MKRETSAFQMLGGSSMDGKRVSTLELAVSRAKFETLTLDLNTFHFKLRLGGKLLVYFDQPTIYCHRFICVTFLRWYLMEKV